MKDRREDAADLGAVRGDLHRRPCREQHSALGVDGSRELVPDLDLVAVEIPAEEVRLARTEFAAAKDGPASGLDRLGGGVDVVGAYEPEAEVSDTGRLADRAALGGRLSALEDQRVTVAGGLHLHEVAIVEDHNRSEDLAVEARRALRIRHPKRDVGETVSADHAPRRWLPVVRPVALIRRETRPA
jgi:hypothetical protein